ATAFVAAWAPALQGITSCYAASGARERRLAHTCLNIVIASAAKQSRIFLRMHFWIASLRSQ
ncbi:hypothetical protein, partial [Bradyrhizobium sp. CCBAU 11357]|uniref:hypothetical protein n=1 Tax=Bradyrhizobium sp. CCBAU 11357 TaxID=1630808 RepID=UPI0023043CBE